jgi:hypothetical protein
VEYLAAKLDEQPPPVRADLVRVVRAVVADFPGRWSRRRRVPLRWVLVREKDDRVEVRVEPATFRELSAYGYLDEFSRWVGRAVSSKREGEGYRCAALVYGDGVHALINGGCLMQLLALLMYRRFYSIPPDSHVVVLANHESVRRMVEFDLVITVSGRLAPRARFHDDLHAFLEGASPGGPGPDGGPRPDGGAGPAPTG